MLKKLKPKSEFSKNVLTLMTGTTIAQAIPIAISPILTRIYTPEDFGIYALFIAITSIIAVVATGRYELAVMLPKKEEDAISIFVLGLVITFLLSLGFLIVVILLNDYIASLLENDEIGFWLYFIPLAILFTGFFNNLKYFNNRKKKYKDIANATVFKSFVLAIVQVIIGILKPGATGLVVGHISSQFFANMKLFNNIKNNIKINKLKIIALAKKYKDFPIHNAPSTLLNNSASQMPFLLLPIVFSLSVAGQFMLAKKIISLPSSLIAASISQVFFQKMTEVKNSKNACRPLLFKTIIKLTLFSFFIALFIFVLSPIIFVYIFGEQWKLAGEIAQYLALVFFITFIVSSVSNVYSISGYVKCGAMWKYIYFVTTLSIYSISVLLELDIYEFLYLFVIHEYILYILSLYLIVKSINELDSKNLQGNKK